VRYTFKTKPYPHQVKALKKIVPKEGGALFMPMRSGKTKTAIDWAGMMHLRRGSTRVLIVCPLSVTGVWKKQIKIHMPEEIRKKMKFLILNYERVYDRERTDDGWNAIPRKALYKWLEKDKYPLIIVDEAHKIGNPMTVQSRELYKLQRDISSRPLKLILTGTPFHRKLLMAYGQFRFLDERILSLSWSRFKKEYGKWGGYGGFKLLGTKNRGRLNRLIAPYTFLMKTLPHVPPQFEIVPYQLEESEEAYASMANDFIAWVGDGVVEAPIALVKALRLAQICGGRLRDSEGKMQRVGHEKRRTFDGLVSQFEENEVGKFVVFARFIPELGDICRVCRAHGYKVYLMYGKTPGPERERRIAEFDETPDKAVFVSQVSTGALGIDLSSAAIEVFYSLPESLVTYDQDVNRIRRFRDKRTLSYYYLIGEGTVEEVTLAALRSNLDLIDAIERDPLLLSYETRG
jgi:superfamily II DNA or RNA helicase